MDLRGQQYKFCVYNVPKVKQSCEKNNRIRSEKKKEKIYILER